LIDVLLAAEKDVRLFALERAQAGVRVGGHAARPALLT
jgi:hypothetical protein